MCRHYYISPQGVYTPVEYVLGPAVTCKHYYLSPHGVCTSVEFV